jgi:hypothetical protein
MQSFLPLLGGFGLGMLFHAPYQALTSALSPKELAAGTGAFFLVRFTGATVGLARLFHLMCIASELTRLCAQSIAGAIYQGSVSRNVLHGASLSSSANSTSLNQVPMAVRVGAFRVRGSQDTARYLTILNFVSRMQDVWIVCAPCLGSALLVR